MKNSLLAGLIGFAGVQGFAQPGSCPLPAISYTADCGADSTQLIASPGFDTYTWFPAAGLSDSTIQNPMALLNASTTYSVITSVLGPQLIVNSDFSMGNTAFISGQTYSPWYSPCNYYVGDYFFTTSYYFPDHSPSADNFYMSIDGCSPATVLWEQTIPAVDVSETYNFSFWGTRADQVQPIYEVHLIGNVTGDVIVATQPGIPYTGVWTWDEYGITAWNSGPNTSVTIRVVNLETNGYGDDFGIDDFSFRKTCIDTASITLSDPELIAGFDFVAGCPGAETVFIDLTPSNPVSWSWNFDDGATSNIQNPQHIFSTPGLYDVTLFVTTLNGCQDTVTASVLIPEMPVADFSFLNDCYYNMAAFTDLSTIPSGSIAQWEWDFGDGTAGVLQNESHQYLNNGIYSVELLVTSNDNCKDSITYSINRYEAPVADFVSSIISACDDVCIPFTDLSSYVNNPIVSWEWDFDNGQSFNTTNPIPCFVNLSGAISYYEPSLIVTNDVGCQDTVSMPDYVTLFPEPVAAFGFSDDCYYNEALFVDLSTISDGSINQWEWDFGDGSTSLLQNSAHQYSSSGTFNVQLVVTSDGNCKDSLTQVIHRFEAPLANFSSITSACGYTCIPFTDLSTFSAIPITSWQWDFGNGQLFNTQNPVPCFANSTATISSFDVALTVINDSGCQNTFSVADYLEIFPKPVASFTYNPNPPDVIHTNVQFTNSSLFADSYSWNFGDSSDFSTVADPMHEYEASPGSYLVTLIASAFNGFCSDTVQTILVIQDEPLFYVPNCFTPDGDGLNSVFQPIFTDGFDAYGYHLTIYDRWGEIIFESYNMTVGWNGTYGDSGLVQDGVYVWDMELKELNSEMRSWYTGHVTVLK